MANLIPGAELHATQASRPLLHHPPTTGQSISSLPTVLPILKTILILEWALEQVMLAEKIGEYLALMKDLRKCFFLLPRQ